MKKIGNILNATNIKIIGMLSMLIDHSSYLFTNIAPIEHTNFSAENNIVNIMHIIGRMAFPIFCFFIAEGYKNTKNINKYIKRLLYLAIISIIPFYLMFYNFIFKYNGFYVLPLNTIFTLLFGLLNLYFIDKVNKVPLKLLVFFCFLFVSIISDAGPLGIIFIFIFSKFKNRILSITIFLLITFIFDIPDINFIFSYNGILFILILLITGVILFNYNERYGKNIKMLFYYFYPIHLMLIYLLYLQLN